MVKKKITAVLATTMMVSQLSPIAVYAKDVSSKENEEAKVSLGNNEVKNKEEVKGNDDLKGEVKTEESVKGENNQEEVENKEENKIENDKSEEEDKTEDEKIEEVPKNEEIEKVPEEEDKKEEEDSENKEDSNESSVTEPYKLTGSLELDMNFSTPIKYKSSEDTKIDILIKNDKGFKGTISLGNNKSSGTIGEGIEYNLRALNGKKKPLDGEEELSFYHLSINNLELGNYTVEISGVGYAKAVIPNIEIQNSSKRVIFGTSDKTVLIDNEEKESHSAIKEEYKGVFLSGDVNGDGVVNKIDYDLMKAEIKKDDKGKNLDFDLNRDQKVDITDLSYIHTNLDKSLGSAVIVDTNPIINPDNVSIDVDTTTVNVTGEIKNILKDNGSTVKLETKNNAPISEENPIDIPINLGKTRMGTTKMENVIIKAPGENAPSKGKIVIPKGNEDGSDLIVDFNESNTKKISQKTANREVLEAITIDLGKQVAVSEVTIKVTGGRGNKNLAEIASVEFINNVYKELPQPKINIPVINNYTSATAVGSEFMQFKWEHQPNVTAYELKVEKLNDNGEVVSTRKYKTSENFLRIEGGVSGYEIYRVSIQSLSGDEWSSGYKDNQEGYDASKVGSTNLENNSNDKDGKADNVDKNYKPQEWNSETGNLESGAGQNGMYGSDSIIELQLVPETAPEGPEGITAEGLYKGLKVNWKAHKKAKDYDLYYRKVGEGAWTKANDPNEPKYVDSNVENDIPDGVINLKPDEKNDEDELIRNTSYIIKGLDDNQTYELKMTATNHHGTGGLSQTYLGRTANFIGPEMPKYKLINTPKATFEKGEPPVNGIVDIEYPNYSTADHPNGIEDKFVIVDGDYSTYWTSFTWNTSYTSSPKITFDKEYEMDTFMIATRLDAGYGGNAYDYVPVRYFDSEKNEYVNVNGQYTVQNSNGKRYYKVTLDEPIKTKELNVALRIHPMYEPLSSISEIKFYNYDSLEKDVEALFKDELMLELADGVTQEKVDSLRVRANTIDSVSMEYHPNRKLILENIERAQDILDDINLDQNIKVLNPMIINSGNTIGQSNNWQSLGVSAKPGDKVNVYIGSTNPNTKFELAITQHYAESGTALKTYNMELVPGKNEITIPESAFQMDYEKGGNLFIRFKSNYREKDVFKVRTSGTTKIPHLNLNKLISDESKEKESKAIIREYITELKNHVSNLPKMYPSKEDKENNIYTYDPMTSILNSTEIEGDRITLSLAADQVLNGITSGLSSEDEQVERVYKTLLAWEQIMKVSYSQQGLIEAPIDFDGDGEITDKALETLNGKSERAFYNQNKAPQNRINIKYQRMFTGAFMYASGHHVGIGYGSVPSMMTGVPFKVNSNGELVDKEDGSLFGWGIGHEIGHVHDRPGLTKAEVTNNILPLITQTFNDVNKSRLEEGDYKNVYDKVTSGSIGGPSGRTALAMYWQLHLAYDNNYTYEMLKLNSDADINNDTIYAKIYRAARENGVAQNESGYNQFEQSWIMRASDAAGKDLRPFFLAWGIESSPKTNEYLSSKKYPVEEKKIQYLNDSARRKRLTAMNSNNMGFIQMAKDTKVVASFGTSKDNLEVQNNSYLNQKNVPLKLSVNKDTDKILGYEIIRQESTSNGIKEAVVGFVERDKESVDGITNYSDLIDGVNNKVFTYKIKAYDYDLNVTDEVTVGTVKIRHDGSISKNTWSFESNTIGANDEVTENSGHGQSNTSIKNLADNDVNTVYSAKRRTDNNGNIQKGDLYVTVDLGSSRQVTGLKYNPGIQPKKSLLKKLFGSKKEEYAPINNYEVFISNDNKTWTKVHSGKFDSTKENTIYFNKSGNSSNSELWANNVQYVKLVAKGIDTMSIAELDVIGQPGDNIEIGLSSDKVNYKNGLGKLSTDYEYAEGKVIPKGSIIVNGEYKGDPAFNIPLVLNENGDNFALEAQAILLAEVPEGAELGEVASGSWIYWITPEQQEKLINGEANMVGKKIKAELYRFNSLDSNNKPVGQRLVSDTFYLDLPENLDTLPEISLNSGQAKNKNKSVINIDSKLMNSVVEARK